MSAQPTSGTPGFFVVGGTMRPDAESYVRRNADEELYAALVNNEFCHVLTARQMGKSSLMLRTAARLRQSGISVAALDLTGIGTNLSPEQWYGGLIVQLGSRLNLEDELLDFWQANLTLGPMQRWVSSLRKVVLPLHAGRLAIFVDEIDAVASLSFPTDEFFAGIRECYNLRHEDADINRLTFCLLGVASPSLLIRDTRTTPFNVGRRIELNDFTEEEALPLARGLVHKRAASHTLLKHVFFWTNGHPYLTQRLCHAVSENGSASLNDINESIERMFFSKQAQEYDENLIFVRERMLRSGVDTTELLNLYSRVRRRKKVADDDSQPLVSILRLSGITSAQNGTLRVRNRIYDRVFNAEWIRTNLPGAEVRRQRAAFRRGVIRTTAVATGILLVMAALAITAMRQRNIALSQTALSNRMLYLTRMKLANQEYENANITRVEQLVELTRPGPDEKDLRGFEWYLFWRYAHKEALRITEPGQIASAKFSANDEIIAVAEVIHTMVQHRREYLVKLFDRRTQQETTSFTVPAGINFDIAVFSHDNKIVATDSPDNGVTIWDIASQQLLKKLEGPGDPVVSLAFAPAQETLAAAFVRGKFRVWDRRTGVVKFDERSQLELPSIAFSPDGKQLAVTSSETEAQLRDATTGKLQRTISVPKGPLSLIFFSPDGSRLFLTTSEGKVFSWTMRKGQLLALGGSHSAEVLSFSFSPDNKLVATGSMDRTLKLWDVATGKEMRTIFGHGGWVTSLHFSADGLHLISGGRDGLIKIWEMAATELPIWPEEKPASISASVFTPGNELLVLGRMADGNLRILNVSKGLVVANLGSIEEVSGAVFSRDATLLALAAAQHPRIYSVATGDLVSTLPIPADDVYSLDFSPDATTLLTGDRRGNVFLSEVGSGREKTRLNSGNMYYRAVFSADGQLIASADQDGKVRIWDTTSSTIKKTLTGHVGVVKLISFSPDGKLLATADDDDTVRIWNPVTGQELAPPVHFEPVGRFVFTPDSKQLITVSLDGAVVLWDVSNMQEVVTLRKRGGEPSSVSFSKDGFILAVTDVNGTIKVWRAGHPTQ